MTHSTRLDLRLSPDLKHRITLEAARDNRTMANVVIMAVEQYLAKKETHRA